MGYVGGMTWNDVLKSHAKWLLLVSLDVCLRIAMIFFIPIIILWWLHSSLSWTQGSAQASFTVSGFLTDNWPKYPKTDWKLLLFGTKQPSRDTRSDRVLDGEILPPLDNS